MRFSKHVGFDDRRDVLHGHLVDHHRASAAGVTVHQRQYFHLVLRAATQLLERIAANVGLVNLNRAAATTEHDQTVVLHGFADTVPKEPSGLEGNPEGPVKLVGADALLARRDQEDRLKP